MDAYVVGAPIEYTVKWRCSEMDKRVWHVSDNTKSNLRDPGTKKGKQQRNEPYK